MSGSKDYKEELTKALIAFQFLEEVLRLYLRAAYSHVQVKAGSDLVINLSIENLKGKALGAILEEFKKFNGDERLISDISKLIPKRNEIAHKAFRVMIQKAKERDSFEDQLGEIRATKQKTLGCMTTVMEEIERMHEKTEASMKINAKVAALNEIAKRHK